MNDIIEHGSVIQNPDMGWSSEDQITVPDLPEIAVPDIQNAKMVDSAIRAKVDEGAVD